MTVQCVGPDPDLGIAPRLATYLDCQSRALGENGFQALAGSAATTALVSASVTIFVALIGYRLILGRTPSLRDGVGWAVRLGIVLTLVTSWPAFQVLVFRVVTEAPGEIAAIILPAAGLPAEDLDGRVQATYDRLRLGSTAEAPTVEPRQTARSGDADRPTPQVARIAIGMPPLPRAASVFVAATSGVSSALRLAAGFLLAIGPLASLCLLFQATLGLFEGWLRALTGVALGTLAAMVVTAVELIMLDSELVHADAMRFAEDTSAAMDPQGLVTIIMTFVPAILVTVYAAWRVAGAIRLPAAPSMVAVEPEAGATRRTDNVVVPVAGAASMVQASPSSVVGRSRTVAVTEALSAAAYRDGAVGRTGERDDPAARPLTIRSPGQDLIASGSIPLGVAGRRSAGRTSLSAKRRDMPA